MPISLYWPRVDNLESFELDQKITMFKVLELLGNPQNKLTNIMHITGTNGKGSVAEYISTILIKSGIKTGKYYSPHIYDICERISINKENILVDDLYSILEKIRYICEKQDIQLTEFQATTLIMIEYFSNKNTSANVIEVGMGGLCDATNIFTASQSKITIITPIDLDHVKFLGNTIQEISAHKAYLIKENSICISATQKPEALAIIEKRCQMQGSILFLLGRDFEIEKIDYKIHIKINEQVYQKLQNLKFENKFAIDKPRLLGDHQYQNAAIAAFAAIIFDVVMAK
jgi:dihydrofolate synthase / folylpolyglutamate synthase